MKQNDFNPSYIGGRNDIFEFIPEIIERVLDVGCSIGALGEQIKRKTFAEVIGIEVDEKMAREAESRLDRVINADIEELDLKKALAAQAFDCIIFADVLEHLKDPQKILKDLAAFLKEDGIIIACIPNVRHYSTLMSLIFKGTWPYRDRGIHDRTHLRFFCLKNIRELFAGAGLQIKQLKRKYRLLEHRNHRLDGFLATPGLKDFFTFQYIIIGSKTKN